MFYQVDYPVIAIQIEGGVASQLGRGVREQLGAKWGAPHEKPASHRRGRMRDLNVGGQTSQVRMGLDQGWVGCPCGFRRTGGRAFGGLKSGEGCRGRGRTGRGVR